MITISKEAYRDKVRGCWLGKNIGGTLGAPFEGCNHATDLDFYTTDLSSGALPNDDLDLQLSWLCAAERYQTGVNAKILAEYWVTTIMPNWAEYGVGKSNLRLGLEPPLSGTYCNAFKDSNGAWIRSELWACLMPGHPELAVKYAYEDAIVDHADEGVYAEVFTAALESAAFVCSDLETLIDIGLSYIPADCGVAKAVRIAQQCYAEKMTWKQARIKLLSEVPGSFGRQSGHNEAEGLPLGPWGYDAPNNIGIVVIGWLFGEGDFGRSLCIAAGCGEDGDCTTATLGSILGIILGADRIPKKWSEPIGENIATCSLNLKSSFIHIPKDINELTDRTCRLMPAFMIGHFDPFASGAEISMLNADELADRPRGPFMLKSYCFKDYYPVCAETFTGETAIMKVQVSAIDGINIQPGAERRLKLHAENVSGFVGAQLWLELRWILPEDWTITGGTQQALFLNQYHCGTGNAEAEFAITVGTIREPVTTVLLEVRAHDRPGRIYIPVQFVCSADDHR